jgi:hypothetical protein
LNSIYDNARRQLLTAGLNWPVDPLVVSAWSGALNFLPTETTIAAIKARGFVERGVSLPINNAAVTTDGTAQTDQVVIPAVPIGADVTRLTLAKVKTPHDNSELVLFIDEAEGLPFVTNGLDLVVQPDWVQNRGWFRP